MFKVEHKFEKYLDILEGKFLKHFINFRMGNNYLSVEKGRWYRQELINVVYVILMKYVMSSIIDLNAFFLPTIELLLYPIDYAEIIIFILLKI